MLGVTRSGAGRPILLIHGLGGSAAVWAPVIELLAESNEVIAIDLPGFGRSDAPADESGASPGGMARAVAGMCEELGIERPAVAGNSLGAWVALELAADGGASSVCAISPAGLWESPLGPGHISVRRIARRLRPLLPLAMSLGASRRALLGASLAHPERLSRTEATTLVRDWIDAPGYDAANRQMRRFVFERAGEVTVPCAIAWGAADRVVGRPRPERIPPIADYMEVSGWGHTPTWDDPEGVTALIRQTAAEGFTADIVRTA